LRQGRTRLISARKASRGDPVATRAAILAVVDAAEPPLRIFFGDGPLAVATRDYEQRLATWRAWEPVSKAAQGQH
ncbi:MAG TPA: short-chain dehydrogenase/reductase, partial [Burkholderiaceae bacterium]|nr:short-chain dehydrogenase/reductase [Burkholderiaceae bacterium]